MEIQFNEVTGGGDVSSSFFSWSQMFPEDTGVCGSSLGMVLIQFLYATRCRVASFVIVLTVLPSWEEAVQKLGSRSPHPPAKVLLELVHIVSFPHHLSIRQNIATRLRHAPTLITPFHPTLRLSKSNTLFPVLLPNLQNRSRLAFLPFVLLFHLIHLNTPLLLEKSSIQDLDILL